MIATHVPVSILPVVGFLALLMSMDSYKLVSLKSVLGAIGVGVLVAGVCYVLNIWLFGLLGIGTSAFARYVAPPIEETLKAVYVVALIRAHRVGFLVDAAIFGFAIGTGFAVVENLHYLKELSGAGFLVWVVRGFGTAIMHGGTTAIFAILSKGFTDRHDSTRVTMFAPGLGLAISLHALFNHFVLSPLVTTGLLLATFPLLLILVFERSEHATRQWLGIGFDTDIDLLEQITTGEIHETRIGRYLESLKGVFPPLVMADLLCYLQIHLELSIRAKGLLLARKAGLDVAIDDTVRENLKELRFLEKSVGMTGKIALQPFINLRNRDLWQLDMLEKRGKKRIA